MRRLAWELAQFTLREAEERRRRGQLEFHDLLVLARAVLRDPEHGWDVRAACARATRTSCSTSSRTPTPSSAISPRCSHPGDPTRATRPLGRAHGRARAACSSSATPSSRSTGSGAPTSPRSSGPAARSAPRRGTSRATSAPPRPVIDFVNHVFGDLIVAEPGVAARVRGARARARAPRRHGPAVVLLGVDPRRASSPRPTSSASARPPTSPRPSARALRDGLAGRRSAPRRRPSRASRAASATSASCCPARTSLGQLEDALDAAGIPYRAETSSLVYGTPRDPRPARRAAGGRRPHRRARARRARCARRCSAAATTTSTRSRSSTAAAGTTRRRCPSRCPPTTRSATRCACSPRGTTPGCGSSPERAARPHRARAARARGRLRARPPARPVAPRAVRDRPGPRVLGGRGRQPARLPRAGPTSRARGRARRRDRAARDRRRRGAHPHHPRRQGTRVPDHDRVGHDHQGASRAAGVQLLLPPRPRRRTRCGSSARVTTEEFERYAPIDEQMDFHEKLRLLYVA